MDMINNYDFKCKKNSKEIIECIKKFGIAYVPNYIEEKDLSLVKKIFYECFDKNQNRKMVTYRHYKHPTNPGEQLLIDTKIAEEEGYPEFENYLKSNFLYEVCEYFYGKNKFTFNNNIRFTNLIESKNPILPWHFDRTQALKFWIYVEDADRSCGALEYCPGTHWEGKYRSAYDVLTGKTIDKIRNDIPNHRIQNPITLEGKAGDLFIFDADGFHRGGVIEKNKKRSVIRADSYPLNEEKNWTKNIKNIFKINWWISSKLNLSRLLNQNGYLGTRTISEKMRDESKSRDDY